MPILTLTSDLGLKDSYVASIKGAILRLCPSATIVDVTHQVPKFDISQAAFILKNAFKNFPQNTIHIVGVFNETGIQRGAVAVCSCNQFFIAADNGILPFVLENEEKKIIELSLEKNDSLLHLLENVFVEAACRIANGSQLESLGKTKKILNRSPEYRPVVTENSIRGSVVYIDDFGNIMINISGQLFDQSTKGRHFTISMRSGGHTLHEISKSYNDVPQGELLAFFGSSGLLEIAINSGNASELLGIKINDIILVDII